MKLITQPTDKNEKKIIREKIIENISLYELDDLNEEQAIDQIKTLFGMARLKAVTRHQWLKDEDVNLSFEYYGYSGDYDLDIILTRPESDEELKTRLRQETESKKKFEDKERQLYETLRKKYE